MFLLLNIIKLVDSCKRVQLPVRVMVPKGLGPCTLLVGRLLMNLRDSDNARDSDNSHNVLLAG